MAGLQFPQTLPSQLRDYNNSKEKEGKKNLKTLGKDLKIRLQTVLLNAESSKLSKVSSEEMVQWSKSLEKLLATKDGTTAFSIFLKSEFSEENIEFWLACEDYKKTKSSSKLASKAAKIYKEFIQQDAPKEINIDFHTRETISKVVTQSSQSCFSEAQKIIYNLMEKDSYPRFLKSESYLNLLNKPRASRVKG
ncbi:regulator of G-protein signaling 21 [Latimeria chalumnae]|uniref:Regulator of G protein signaling 1 n=1 Tax=Latimeria chalumnae TaxID=7897 RepID=M3XJN6_LATCH|nr:PREDICTED: regulator of G-protein signaling 1-like [Latimeria chalumnae]|eukprot:XP_006014062.1 PREDICTED: regulator of G-protein signaling 1-like [Latimeria chalumnae]